MDCGDTWLGWGLSLLYVALTMWAIVFYGFDLIRTPFAQLGVLYLLLGSVSFISIHSGFRRLCAPKSNSSNGPGLRVLSYFLFPAAYSAPGLAVLSDLMPQFVGGNQPSPWILPVLVHIVILGLSGLLLWIDS